MVYMVYNCSMEINKPIILASGSPRRREILDKLRKTYPLPKFPFISRSSRPKPYP